MARKMAAVAIVASLAGLAGWMATDSESRNPSRTSNVSTKPNFSSSETDSDVTPKAEVLASSAAKSRPAAWKRWSTQQRLRFDLDQGQLTADEYLVLGVRSIVDPTSLPHGYQADAVAKNASQATLYEYLEVWDQASPEAQQEASDLMNDPSTWSQAPSKMSATEEPKSVDMYSSSTYSQNVTRGHFSISWSTQAEDPVYGLSATPDVETWYPGAAPSGVVKLRKNRTPDFVDRVHFALEEAYSDYVALGYKSPLANPISVFIGDPPCAGTCGGFVSPLPQHSIYLAPPPSPSRSEATFDEFYLPRHELFHHFQFQYKWGAEIGADGPDYDFWWLEATAEWAAHKSNFSSAYPTAVTDDNATYAQELPTAMALTRDRMTTCIDFEDECYGDFIFAELLEQRYGRETIREVWEEMATPAYPNAATALQVVLGRQGSSFNSFLPDYARSIYRIATDFVDASGDVWGKQLWLNTLESSTLTASDGLGGARPFHDTLYVEPQAVATGGRLLDPGGIHYVDVALSSSVLDQPAWVSFSITGNLANVSLQALPFSAHPYPCTSPQVRTTTSGYLVRLGDGCSSATFVITHTDPLALPDPLRVIDWSAQLASSVGPLQDEAAGYWRFGESGGTVAIDTSGNGLHGTYSGGPTFGRPGALVKDSDTAVRLNGGNWMRIAGNAVFQTATATVEAWVRPARGSRQYVFTRGGTNGQTALQITDTNRAQATVYVGGFPYTVTGTTDVTEGRWHHVVLTYDGSYLRLYVDGREDASVAKSGALDPFTGVGPDVGYALNSSGYRFIGDVDELAYYSRALGAADVARHFESGGTRQLQCQANGPYAQAVCADQPLSYWRLDDTNTLAARDEVSPRNPGSYESGVTLGKQGAFLESNGGAARFDGVDDRVTVPYEEYGRYAVRKGSIETWARTTRPNSQQFFVNRGGTYGQLVLGMTDTNKPMAKLVIDGVGFTLTGDSYIAEGRWHHLALTYDGDIARLYVDGIEEDRLQQPGQLDYLVGAVLDFGYALNSSGYRLQGDLDEVAVYDRALTQADIDKRIQLAAKGSLQCEGIGTYAQALCADGPIGYWRLGETGSLEARDEVTPRNPGGFESGVTQGVLGALSQDVDTAARFDGADDRIRIPYEEYGRYAIKKGSVEAWVRTTRPGSQQFFVNRGGTAGQLVLAMGEGNRPFGRLIVNGLGFTLSGDSNIADGSWHHLALTYDGEIAKLYVDGLEEERLLQAGQLDYLVGDQIYLGYAINSSGYRVQGDIDEVALWDRALTGAEILERVQLAGTRQVSCTGGTQLSTTICGASPVGYWKLDEPSLSLSAGDSTSVGNHGNYEAGVSPGAPGVSGTGASFDGVDDRVQIPWDTYGRYANDVGAVEVWARVRRSGARQYIFNRGGTYGQLVISVTEGNLAEGRVIVNGVAHTLTSATPVADGQWHQFVLSFDGTVAHLYVDGALAKQAPVVGTLDWYIGTPIHLGYAPNSSGYRLAGEIDEVALFDRPLSGAEVSAHYQASGR